MANLSIRFLKIYPILNKRSYSILPPEWLGGYIGKRILEPIENLKSFDERMKELNPVDEEINSPVDIGAKFTEVKVSLGQLKANTTEKMANAELEQEVRLGKFRIDANQVEQDWIKENGPIDEMNIAKHYAIYEHLFGGATFIPIVQFRVLYEVGSDEVLPVYMGNRISPSQSRSTPTVTLPQDDDLYTLVMSNPDSHLQEENSEYLHWMVANIKNGDISTADTLCKYMPTFPMKGTGFHRHVFTLYKQNGVLDLSAEKRTDSHFSLEERDFNSKQFYSRNEKTLTPVGLVFFQSEYDESVKDVFHNVLNMKEPSFEYKHVDSYHPPPVRYPHYQPFDRYYDRYRDTKDIAEDTLKMRLDLEHFDLEKSTEFAYPLVHRDKNRPTWLQHRDNLAARKREQFKDL